MKASSFEFHAAGARSIASLLRACTVTTILACGGVSDAEFPAIELDAASEASLRRDASAARSDAGGRDGEPDRTARRDADDERDDSQRDAREAAPDTSRMPNEAAADVSTPARDASPDVAMNDAASAPSDAAGDTAQDTRADAARADDAARVCGVPGDCVLVSEVPPRSMQVAGTTLSLCPAAGNPGGPPCVVEANLGAATWSAPADGGATELDGIVGLRARDVVVTASTLLGVVTCHFAVGGAGFAPVSVRVRLGASPPGDVRVGCSPLMVTDLSLLEQPPATVTGPAPLCTDFVLPQLEAAVLPVVEDALRQAIVQQRCLR
jgi:hypothetical protein